MGIHPRFHARLGATVGERPAFGERKAGTTDTGERRAAGTEQGGPTVATDGSVGGSA